MVEEHQERADWLRHRAKRLRNIAERFPTQVSPILRQLADEMETWADELVGGSG
jgi:CHAD domain-containing protein